MNPLQDLFVLIDPSPTERAVVKGHTLRELYAAVGLRRTLYGINLHSAKLAIPRKKADYELLQP